MWIALIIAIYLLFIVLNILSYAQYYLSTKLSVGGFAQILYTMQNSMSGSENTVLDAVKGFFEHNWLLLLLGTLVFGGMIWLYLMDKKGKIQTKIEPMKFTKILKRVLIGLACFTLLFDVFLGVKIYDSLGIKEYNESLNKESDLYDKYYADARKTNIEFPEKKRNLIYIICESMESTYTDKKNGGGFQQNLIPELTALAQENTDFTSQEDSQLNGGYTPGNTTWTIAGIAAQSMGVPLNIGNNDYNRNFEEQSKFLPSVKGLGDILEEEGYQNYFMCGSDGAFAGRKNYYQQHGDYKVLDYYSAIDDGIIDKDYYVWWGYEDNYLFKYAEKELNTLAKQSEPFNFTMLTVDTHFQNGYKCKDCPDTFDEQYENVINCSDRKIAEFVKWCQKQDFYKDTTIVISGDHLSMDGLVPESIDKDYQRRTYFTVINGPEYSLNKTRAYSTMDIFPTILEALGAKIDGHRLGLGTSLYSDIPTLIEIMGYEEVNQQMSYKSKFYEDVILSGDEGKIPTPTDEKEESESKENTQPVQAPTAQQYQANKESFSNTDYIWIPSYSEPATNPGTGGGTTDPGTGGETTDPGTGGGTTEPGTGGETTDPGTGGGTTEPGTGGETTDPGTGGGTTEPGTGGGTTEPGTGGGTTEPGTGGETTDPGTGGETTDPGTGGGTTDPGAPDSQ
ncbi:LTA synthase family protein [uncultured Dubosiella sp.]|mgnify:FL=1|uniref:LTA synthase family protein n=5 Tax=uncultured Dubosiella sp. TaxID=1937011 RepID=UPI0025B53054|nr:LTA synthase family protein [uncultured Dubosiella sp.]